MKARILLMLSVVIGAALLARGVAAQPYPYALDYLWGGVEFQDVAVDLASNRVYVTVGDIGGVADRVAVFDGASTAWVATVHVSSGTEMGAVDVNSTTSRVYVTVPDSGSVWVIDGTTNTVVATVPVGLSPLGVAANPTTNLIYVANIDSNDVSVIDGGSNTVVATIPVGQWPMGVAVNPTTNLIYVANAAWSGTVSVIDGGSNTVVGNIPVGFSPQRVAVNPNTNSVYVAMEARSSGGSGDLLVIDGTTNTVAATFPGMDAEDVAVNPTTNHVLVADEGGVTLIDGATNSVVTSIPVVVSGIPAQYEAVAANPVTNLVYVAATWLLFGPGSVSKVKVIEDSPGAGPPPVPSPTPLPPATPAPCPPAPAPPLAEGMEWVALQCGTCSAVTTTYPDGTSVGTVAGAVAPPGAVDSLWGFEGGLWQGYSPQFPAESDLTEVDRLDVVFICVGGSGPGAATFTRPVP